MSVQPIRLHALRVVYASTEQQAPGGASAHELID
jgi:hypothetical protein